MALQGHIYRGKKPVHWSPSSCTALAEDEDELELLEGHVSKSIYASFNVVEFSPSSTGLLEDFLPHLYLAIWTRVWTMPADAGTTFYSDSFLQQKISNWNTFFFCDIKLKLH